MNETSISYWGVAAAYGLLIIPLLLTLVISFGRRAADGTVIYDFSVDNYVRLSGIRTECENDAAVCIDSRTWVRVQQLPTSDPTPGICRPGALSDTCAPSSPRPPRDSRRQQQSCPDRQVNRAERAARDVRTAQQPSGDHHHRHEAPRPQR